MYNNQKDEDQKGENNKDENQANQQSKENIQENNKSDKLQLQYDSEQIPMSKEFKLILDDVAKRLMIQEGQDQQNQDNQEKLTNEQQILKSVEQTTKDTEKLLQKVDKTLAKTNTTYENIKKTNQDIQKMENLYHQVFEKMENKLSALQSVEDEIAMPEISDIQSVATQIIQKSYITVLSGSGISVKSGIPTIKGENSLIQIENELFSIKKVLTKDFFSCNPIITWEFIRKQQENIKTLSPNISHLAIENMQDICTQQQIKLCIATLNYDNFHIDCYVKELKNQGKEISEESKETSPLEFLNSNNKQFGRCDHIYELCGNLNYGRCLKNCSNQLFSLTLPSKITKENLPKCPFCNGLARPHILFFDEEPDEKNYKSDSFLSEIAQTDCLIIIGSNMNSNFLSQILSTLIEKNVLIVEINPEPVIEIGNVKKIVGKAEEIVPELCNQIQNQISEFYSVIKQ